MNRATIILLACVGALLSLGMVMLYSSSNVQVGARYLMMQMVWCAVGVVGAIIVGSLDYRRLKEHNLPWIFLGVVAVLLVLVLLTGRTINGAKRWLEIGPARFQPSELAKIALVLVLAWYGERYQRHMQFFWRGLVVPGLVAGAVLGLIFIEPDRGTTILLAAVTAAMLLTAGVRLRYFFPPLILLMAGAAVYLWNDPMPMKRIFGWLYLEEHKDGVGYQAWQAMIALGSGGWSGLGLGNGRQKLGFVPEHHTDFIFSIVGEELGLIATLGVVLAFVLLVVCGLYIAWRARDGFGQLLATGLTLLIGLQAFINIGVVTSALPNKGMPLPFISYGGSNLLVMLLCVGLLFSIARQAGETVESESEALEDKEIMSPQFT